VARKARFTTDEALVEFTRRAGCPKTLEDQSGEIALELTEEQYANLRKEKA
jgi:hypothetical protein